MSGPGPQPTPQPAPTPTVSIPQVPPNTYELLSSVADAIDTANGEFTTHATKLSNLSTEANGAVNNVVSTSSGGAVTALSDTWKNTQGDLNHAHDPLTSIVAKNCMGGSPNPLRETLNQNKSSIQTGLTAAQNLMAYKQNRLPQPPTAQQVEEWIQDVNALTNSLGNVNMALQVMILAIRNVNGGFSAHCVTGFTPGQPLPTFTKTAFSSTGGGGGGDDPVTRQRIINALGGDSGLANIIIDEALGHGVSLDSVATLLEKGVSETQVFDWIDEGVNIDNVTTLVDNGVDANRINTWISRGVNIDNVAAFVSNGVDADTAAQLTKAGVNPTDVLPLIKEGVSPNTILNMLKNPDITPANVGRAIESNITNLINDSNPDFRITRTNAIRILNGPDGTVPQVAGAGVKGGDVNFIDSRGNIVLSREVKCITSQTGFTGEMRSLPKQFSDYSGPREAVFQVPSGTNGQSWVNAFLKSQPASSLAKYRGINIEIVDPQGNVLWQGPIK